MEILKRYGVVSLLLLATGLLLAACGGGGGGTASSGGGGGGGTPATGTISLTGFSYASVSGLVYDPSLFTSAAVNTTTTTYFLKFHDTSYANYANLIYTIDTSTSLETLTFNASPNTLSTIYTIGTPSTSMYCVVTGTSVAIPTCASLGISVNRAAGTFSLASTPAYDMGNTASTGTMTGSLTFTPF